MRLYSARKCRPVSWALQAGPTARAKGASFGGCCARSDEDARLVATSNREAERMNPPGTGEQTIVSTYERFVQRGNPGRAGRGVADAQRCIPLPNEMVEGRVYGKVHVRAA